MAEVQLAAQDRLAFLLQELTVAVEPEARFTLRHQIDELCKSFAEVDGQPRPSYLDNLPELSEALQEADYKLAYLTAAGQDTTAALDEILRLRRQSIFAEFVPWGKALLQRLDDDGAQITRLWMTSPGRWLLQIRLPDELRDLYGTASEVLVLAVSGAIRGEDLEQARDELQRGEYDLDLDLLIIVDGRPDLEGRLAKIYRLWGQWVPWAPINGIFPPLGEQVRPHLSAYDLFEVEDPVRGRQVIGRNDLIADISKRLQRGQALGIFGLRKVGKTTLCRAVTDRLDPISRFPLMSKKASRLTCGKVGVPVVWIDARDLFPRTLEALIGKLTRHLDERLALENIDLTRPSVDDPLADLSNLLKAALKNSHWPVCIVFDEYDLLFETEDGDPAIREIDQLFRMFRAHAQSTNRLALVVIGRDSEFFDRPEMNGRPNPMLNWFVPRWPGPMEPPDADELLRRLGRRVGLDIGEETARLARHWTGGHPLLHRQLGSALLELTRGKKREREYVPTDPFCADAIDLFLDRDAVLTTCRDVYFLLMKRYPEASTRLRELSRAKPQGLAAVIENIGGWHEPAIRTLRKFGILLGTAQAPVIPELLLWYNRLLAIDADRIAV